MSPRAAWRLEALGFGPVYDYTTGKVDWLAAGRPTGGRGPNAKRVLDALAPAPMTCSASDLATTVGAQMRIGGVDLCVVVNDQQIVQGRLRMENMPDPPTGVVETAMEPGPATIRPNDPLDGTLQRMVSRHVDSLIVTTPDGLLLGIIRCPG